PAQPCAAQPGASREERLVRDDPGHAELGVVYGAEVSAERAVLVGAQARGDKEAPLVPEFLLHERAERDRLVGRFIGQGGRPGGNGRAPGCQVVRVGAVAVEHVLDVLNASRAARREGWAQNEGRGGIRVRRVVEEDRAVVGLEARNGGVADGRALVATAQVGVHAVREVDPPTTRTPNQLWGRQFAVPLPIKRSMSWFTVSEKNWSGVYRR